MLKIRFMFSLFTTASHSHPILATLGLMCVMCLAQSSSSLAGNVLEIYPRVLDEKAPAGGMIQLKVQLTEPRPVTFGSVSASDDGTGQVASQQPLGGAQAVALFDPAGTVSGAAVVDGYRLTIRFVSPRGTFGTGEESPIIAVSIPVRPDATLGQTVQLTIDPNASFWIAPSGEEYVQEVVSGVFTVGGSVSISNVVPGGRFVHAGSTVRVTGIGFQPLASVQIDEVEVASTRYVSPTQLDVVLGKPTQMYGKRVRVTNPDSSSATYYSFLKAVPEGQSARPLLAATLPIFSTRTFNRALFFPVVDPRLFLGLGFQNPSARGSMITIELFSASHRLIGSSTFNLPSEMRISREISEYLPGLRSRPGDYLQVRSSEPVQMIGLLANDADGSVAPIEPVRRNN
jgi:hypothetical protein